MKDDLGELEKMLEKRSAEENTSFQPARSGERRQRNSNEACPVPSPRREEEITGAVESPSISRFPRFTVPCDSIDNRNANNTVHHDDAVGTYRRVESPNVAQMGNTMRSEVFQTWSSNIPLPPLYRFGKSTSPKARDWTEFANSFRMRYGSCPPVQVIALLHEYLVDKAKDVLYEKMDRLQACNDCNEILDVIGERLGDDSPFQIIECEDRLKELSVQGKKVVEFCQELEELTQKLYSDPRICEDVRKRKLVVCYKGRQEFLSLLREFKHPENSYSTLKQYLMEDEFARGREKELKGENNKERHKEKGNFVCVKCTGVGHKAQDCPTKGEKPIPVEGATKVDASGKPRATVTCTTGELPKCFRCEGIGHFGRQCTTKPSEKHKDKGNTHRGSFPPKETVQNVGPMILNRSSNNTVNAIVDDAVAATKESKEEVKYSTMLKLVSGEIEGVPAKALLDSGAACNIVSLDFVKQIKTAEIEPVEQGTRLRDAQGSEIKTIGRCALTITMEIGKPKVKVGFHVVDAPRQYAILGTPALEAMDLALGQREPDVEQDDTAEIAVVARDVWVKAREIAAIPVKYGYGRHKKVLWSSNKYMPDGIYVPKNDKRQSQVWITVINEEDEPVQFLKGQTVGCWCTLRDDETKDAKEVNMILSDPNEETKKDRTARLLAMLRETNKKEIDENFQRVIAKYEKTFALTENELGRAAGEEYRIQLEQNTPIKQKNRPIPFSVKEPLKQLLQRMESQGVIRPSNSPWNSPLVLVRKKNGAIRLCVDFRKVNTIIRQDAFPLPDIDPLLQSLSGKSIFTLLDLRSGFWQIGLQEESKEITAFTAGDKHYEFTVLPFGLCVSPAVFQRTVQKVLREELDKEAPHKEVAVFVDDILIASRNKEEHVRALERVLDKLNKAGLKINAEKCIVGADELDYLGHHVSSRGVSTNEGKVQGIKNFPVPKNVNELRRFIGAASYYRKFVENFAAKMHCLTKLTSTKVPWKWTEEEQKCFEEMKRALMEAPILAQPDMESAMNGSRPYIITTDACGTGIGAVLSQKSEDGKDRPIAFYSKALTPSQTRYHVTDCEALAVHEAVMRWRHLLYGAHTEVHTDHSPLTTMFSRTNLNPRIFRWAQDLMPFRLKFKFVPGKENKVADALSRVPSTELEPENTRVENGTDLVLNVITRRQDKDLMEELQKDFNEMSEANRNVWRERQRGEAWMENVKKRLKEVTSGKRRIGEQFKVPGSKRKITLADFVLKEEILYLQGEDDRLKLLIPGAQVDILVKEIHESPLTGHVGSEKLLERLKKDYWWPAMGNDVARLIRQCERCIVAKPKKRMIPELKPLIASEPFELVGLDLIDMGRSATGNRYILTIIDHFTKLGAAYPIADKTAENVANVFLEKYVLERGYIPRAILSDNGKEFLNQVMAEIARVWQFTARQTLPYHSRANGITERFNRTLEEIMRTMIIDPHSWEEVLPYAIFAYNASPHGTTGESPFYLVDGRERQLPLVEELHSNNRLVEIDMHDYKDRLRRNAEQLNEVVRKRTEQYRQEMKEKYDNRHAGNHIQEPKVGDLVYVKQEKTGMENPKMEIMWEGPYEVTERTDTTATINVESQGTTRKRIVQIDRLRLGKSKMEKKTAEVNEVSYRQTMLVPAEAPGHPAKQCEECREKRDTWTRDMEEVYKKLEVYSWEDAARVLQYIRNRRGERTSAYIVQTQWRMVKIEDIGKESVEKGLDFLCEHTSKDLLERQAQTHIKYDYKYKRFEEALGQGKKESDVSVTVFIPKEKMESLNLYKRNGICWIPYDDLLGVKSIEGKEERNQPKIIFLKDVVSSETLTKWLDTVSNTGTRLLVTAYPFEEFEGSQGHQDLLSSLMVLDRQVKRPGLEIRGIGKGPAVGISWPSLFGISSTTPGRRVMLEMAVQLWMGQTIKSGRKEDGPSPRKMRREGGQETYHKRRSGQEAHLKRRGK